jgi:hypothetical protein
VKTHSTLRQFFTHSWTTVRLILALAGVAGLASAQQSARISWQPNKESDIAGYKVYSGIRSGQYTKIQDVGKQTSAVVAALAHDTTHYFAVQAYNTSGLASNLSAEVSYKTLPAFAEISITDAAGTSLQDGLAAVSLGFASIGSQDASRNFSVANLGTIDLTGLGTSLSGPHAGDFRIDFSTSGVIAPKGSAELVISLNPSAVGPRQATLKITSNDPDESPFEIQLSGMAGTPGGFYDGWASGGGLTGPGAASSAAPQGDGIPNLIKYAFNLNARGPDFRVLVKGTGKAGLPAYEVETAGNEKFFRIEYIRRVGSGLVYTPKVTSDLITYTALTGTTIRTRIDDEWERVVVRQLINPSAQRKLFGRVEVTMPQVIVSSEIEISEPGGAVLASGSLLSPFPGASPGGGEVYRTLLITNRGNDYLSGLTVSIGGTHSAVFRSMDPLPGVLAPGLSAVVRVAFAPVSAGLHQATLRVTSNDADEALTELQLSALAASPAELFQSWAAAAGLAGSSSAAMAVTHPDGLPNLLAYALATRSGGGLPEFAPSGSGNQKLFTVTYTRVKGSGLIYVPKVSTDLRNFTPMPGTPVVTDLDGRVERVTQSMPVSASQRALFGRVDVTMP